MTPDDIRVGYRRHAALAQFHRWYQFYENPAVPIENQLGILHPNVVVKSGLGEVQGHEAYRQRIAQFPKTWRNAHFLRLVEVTPSADGTTRLSAEVTYLNEGMKPGVVRQAELTYETMLAETDSALPKFTRLEIKQNSETVAAEFTPAYPENRVRSLLHYWLALIEDPARRLQSFPEIFADGFVLNFSSGRIADFGGFESWFRGPASAVAASTHAVENFQCVAASNSEFRMSADFDWEGILPDGREMSARSRHAWLIVDDPNERFARIKAMDVEIVKPFGPNP